MTAKPIPTYASFVRRKLLGRVWWLLVLPATLVIDIIVAILNLIQYLADTKARWEHEYTMGCYDVMRANAQGLREQRNTIRSVQQQ